MSTHTHIIGIAGSGMSAIAHLLIDRGERISGCDRALNASTAALSSRGATVFADHAAGHLDGVDRLLVTSALPADHAEVLAARERNIPVLTRHDLWREWSAERGIIAVAGTHGKTTTTAMLALILDQDKRGLNPGYLIGAEVAGLGGSARWGRGALMVLEADEYARTFLALRPREAIITNIDWDHVDIYPTQESYDAAFRDFATGHHLPPGPQSSRLLIVCGDDPGVQRVLPDGNAIRCGLDAGNEWRATDVQPHGKGMRFTVSYQDSPVGEIELGVPGVHNVRNALLALAESAVLSVPFETVQAALRDFSGAARRFELKGVAGGITVVDDYAHHPAEIRATLAAARARFPQQRLVVYFQPHTYSRLQAFQSEFSAAFAAADSVRIGAVYAAREAAAGADPTTTIVAGMRHPDVAAVGDLEGAFHALLETLHPGDVLITLGAGDGVLVGERILNTLDR